MNIEARDRHPAGVNYQAVGFGEYYFFPPMVWAPDSQSLLLVQHDNDPLAAAEPSVTVWRAPVDGSPAEQLGRFTASHLPSACRLISATRRTGMRNTGQTIASFILRESMDPKIGCLPMGIWSNS